MLENLNGALAKAFHHLGLSASEASRTEEVSAAVPFKEKEISRSAMYPRSLYADGRRPSEQTGQLKPSQLKLHGFDQFDQKSLDLITFDQNWVDYIR